MHTNPKCVLHFIQIVQNYFTLTRPKFTIKKHKELKSIVVRDLNDSVFSITGSQRHWFYSGFGCSMKTKKTKWTSTFMLSGWQCLAPVFPHLHRAIEPTQPGFNLCTLNKSTVYLWGCTKGRCVAQVNWDDTVKLTLFRGVIVHGLLQMATLKTSNLQRNPTQLPQLRICRRNQHNCNKKQI